MQISIEKWGIVIIRTFFNVLLYIGLFHVTEIINVVDMAAAIIELIQIYPNPLLLVHWKT